MAVGSEIKTKNEEKVKKTIAKKEKILLKKIKYKMPDEVGGRIITFLEKKIPSKTYKIMETMYEEKNFDLLEEVIPNWVIDPKVTKKNLYDVFTDFEELTLLMSIIIEENSITQERLEQLRKKAKKL